MTSKKEIISKRFFKIKALYFLFIIFLVPVISCNGQNKSNTKSIDSTKKRAQLNNENFRAPFLNTNNEQINRVIRKVFQDSKGNLWFGTEKGAYRYNKKSLDFFNNIKNYKGQGVTIKDITEDKYGNIWLGHTGGLSKYDGKTITNYYESDGLINNDVWSIATDHNGIVWIGTLQGVCFFNGNKFVPFTIPESKPDNTRGVTSSKIVHCIIKDSKERIWFATNGGAYIYDGKLLSNISEKDGLNDNNVIRILEDNKGNIWFGTAHKGLCRFDGKTFINVSQLNSLNGKEVWDVYQDNSDNIWFAVKGFGVYRYDGKSYVNFNEENGIQSHVIMSIFQDKESRLWFGGLNGLSRFDGKSFITVGKNGPWTK